MKVADLYSNILKRMDKGFSDLAEYFKSADTKIQKYLKATYKNNEYFIDDAKLYLNNKEIFNLYYDKNFRKLFSDSSNNLILGEKTIFKKGEIDFTTKILTEVSQMYWFAYGKISYQNKKYIVTINVEKNFFSGSIQKYNEIKKLKQKINNASSLSTIDEVKDKVKDVIQVLYQMSDILKK